MRRHPSSTIAHVSASLVGPSIAGIAIGLVGEGTVLPLNGFTFFAIILALLSMRLRPQKPIEHGGRALQGLKEGYRYALGFPPIWHILLLLSLLSLVGMSYVVVLPIATKMILHEGPHILGFLMGASGVGALIGAVYVASRRTVLGLGKVMSIASVILALGLMGLCLSGNVWFSMFAMLFIGLGMIVAMVSSNTVLQTIVDEDKGGRGIGLLLCPLPMPSTVRVTDTGSREDSGGARFVERQFRSGSEKCC